MKSARGATTPREHSTLADYERAYGTAMLDRLFKFACVRDPWHRCVSHYFSPHFDRAAWNKQDFVEFVSSEVEPLGSYFSRNEEQTRSLAAAVGNLDFVMRFERLQTDFDELCRLLDLPVVELPRRNASGHTDYAKFYDTQTIDFVGERFRDEIEYFGYTPPLV